MNVWESISWAEVSIGAVLTFASVAVAFWLESVFDRRHSDERVIWAVRHYIEHERAFLGLSWVSATGTGFGPKFAESLNLMSQMTEIDPKVGTWYAGARDFELRAFGMTSLDGRRRRARRLFLEVLDGALAEYVARGKPRRKRMRRLLDTDVPAIWRQQVKEHDLLR